MTEISTDRLIMRNWRESDLEPWAATNADPEMRQFLGPPLTYEQAAWALIDLRYRHPRRLRHPSQCRWQLRIRQPPRPLQFTRRQPHTAPGRQVPQ